MTDDTHIRIQKSTDKKIQRLQKRMNKNRLSKINKGEVVDIAVTEKLEEK